jgi:PAS domain S-box-containing protein
MSPRGEAAFQTLLLRFSVAAAQAGSGQTSVLLSFFCRATREFFQVDGAYLWQSGPVGELVGTEADGWMAEQFRGRRLSLEQSGLVKEAIRQRRALYLNDPSSERAPMASEFQARSIMAVPLIVSDELLGASVFLHTSSPSFFNDDTAARATIVAGQFGGLLEASRLSEASREEPRRARILAEVAHAIHAIPDWPGVVEALADQLRILLRSPLVCVVLREPRGFALHAVKAESAQLAASVRAGADRRYLQFAADLVSRAWAAGEPITVATDPASRSARDLLPPGTLMVAPLRTSQAEGAILVYPRRDGGFTAEERSLVSNVATFGELAMSNAQLYAQANAQAQEVHQLLEITAQLGSLKDIDQFMQEFSQQAGEFLGFGRVFIALREEGIFQLRWGANRGQARQVNLPFPEGVATSALLRKEVFWTNDASKVRGANLDTLGEYQVRDLLVVPMVGSNHHVVGMFGVLDRAAAGGIQPEDIRRAQALAAQVAAALEVKRSLQLSEQHQRRADSLMRLTRELNSVLRLPELATQFVARAREMTCATGGALLLRQETELETVVLEGKEAAANPGWKRRIRAALTETLARHRQPIVRSQAADLLGPELATGLGWTHCTMVRLQGPSDELVGVLCLADAGPIERQDEKLLQAIAGQASVALDNARLFSRMDKANRHWVDIFDAITDFIVVHDASNSVLRVNRPLADFIGVEPQQLIGVDMGALLALGEEGLMHTCPFCRSTGEYVDDVLDRIYLVSTSRVHGAGSEARQTIHVLKDITDRREAERRYRELFDNIQEGLFFATPDGRFIEVNDALVRMLGYATREELLQADPRSQIYTSPQGHQHLIERLFEEGVVRNHEETLRHREGSTVHVLINAFAVRDRQNRVIQYRGVMLDISGLKSFQAELQRERDFSEKILNNTQSLILVLDTAGLISYANRRWYSLGYEHRQLPGQSLDEMLVPARRAALREAFEAVLAGQQVDNLELQIQYDERRSGQFSVNLSPMRDEQGEVTSVIAVMTDVTDAARLQSKLVHTEKMAAVGQLVSGVAHEVNNPLNAILGFADLLMEDPTLPEAARKELGVVLQEAQRSKQIVQNLLSFARQMPPQRKPVQINPILRRTVQLRAYDLHNHGVEVVERLDERLPRVVGDAQQLQQVFLNIVNNAYDAVRGTGRPPRLEITSSRQGDAVEVLFRDNGQGIAPPLERIFEPFFTTKEVGKGTGLGLSICYGIVHEHGGEISCHNNPDGRGATFVVRLPASSELASPGAPGGVTPS